MVKQRPPLTFFWQWCSCLKRDLKACRHKNLTTTPEVRSTLLMPWNGWSRKIPQRWCSCRRGVKPIDILGYHELAPRWWKIIQNFSDHILLFKNQGTCFFLYKPPCKTTRFYLINWRPATLFFLLESYKTHQCLQGAASMKHWANSSSATKGAKR